MNKCQGARVETEAGVNGNFPGSNRRDAPASQSTRTESRDLVAQQTAATSEPHYLAATAVHWSSLSKLAALRRTQPISSDACWMPANKAR